MVGLVPGTLEDSEKDKSGRDRSVEYTEEDQSRYHEWERNLAEYFVPDWTKCWSRHVLISSVDVDDCSYNSKYNDFTDGHSPAKKTLETI